MNQLLGLVFSFGFVFIVMAISSILLSSGRLSPPAARKFIHIAVGHWWFIAMFTMQDPGIAVIGPIFFIVINYVIYRTKLLPAMGDAGSNPGTVYYPVSLLILVVLTWYTPLPKWTGGLAVMILAWGDGLAAVAGERNGKSGRKIRVPGGRKSLAGTMAMFGASLAAALIMQLLFSGAAGLPEIMATGLLLAAVATLVELYTPFGLDNLTVPLSSILVFRLLTGLFS
ncbi:diacylglycerol/polyprenol kinase family protein [Salinispira pacifica]|uniref:Phytol kinase n=1 Tax=Salinispira pacifica TaxID=1307761 RepID=V5WJH9_9SPIO|nr:phytol kinase [Salinispira pacifica]AHC15928.1 phytol kinase [Salinispira pacifica]